MRPALSLFLIAACCACDAEQPADAQPPGLVVERFRATEAPPVDIGDRVITLVRVDPRRYRFSLLTARDDGGARPLPRWVRDFSLTGAINAAMYEPDGGAVGLMVRQGAVHTPRDNPAFGGFLAFGRNEARIFGKDCDGFDMGRMRARYPNVVQSYRMLDCQGRPIPWVDDKAYSAAAVGVDSSGRVVLVHSRTPYRMTALARMLGAPALGLQGLIFVEGGPEASLVVNGSDPVSLVGSYETRFFETDDNQRFWELPNVIGFAPVH